MEKKHELIMLLLQMKANKVNKNEIQKKEKNKIERQSNQRFISEEIHYGLTGKAEQGILEKGLRNVGGFQPSVDSWRRQATENAILLQEITRKITK